MITPKISIIFPTYLRPNEVIWNLEYFHKNLSIPYEVFILDNSPDKMFYGFNENENYIFLDNNIGTASRNIGIEKAKAPYLLLLDDDSHPLPGEIERAIKLLENSADNIAGLITEIHNPDGNREASLLPTVFHGAGVLFKTEVLQKNNLYYPEDYCFYGEEYRLTLEIYAQGFALENTDIKIIHRRSPHGRDLSKIFYYLARNNKAIWKDLVPKKYLEKSLYDSKRRYELTAEKENVTKALEQGFNEELDSQSNATMSEKDFETFSLIDKFKALTKAEAYILCGTGKFTTLWADILSTKCSKVIISDFNEAFHNKSYGKYKILPPTEALKHKGTFLLGHSSLLENLKWQEFLKQNRIETYDINKDYELKPV